jgi:hypothetical protein
MAAHYKIQGGTTVMALSRREFQLVLDRVSKLEMQVRGLEEKCKVLDNRMKGDNLIRTIKETEDEEKRKKERESML